MTFEEMRGQLHPLRWIGAKEGRGKTSSRSLCPLGDPTQSVTGARVLASLRLEPLAVFSTWEPDQVRCLQTFPKDSRGDRSWQ